MPTWFWVVFAVSLTSPAWVTGFGVLYAWAVYGPGTWGDWMAEEEPGEYGPYVPRWRQRPASESYAELTRRYRALAKEATAEATRADEAGLDAELWRHLAATWTEAAETAVARRFSEECTCPDHRAARQAAGMGR